MKDERYARGKRDKGWERGGGGREEVKYDKRMRYKWHEERGGKGK